MLQHIAHLKSWNLVKLGATSCMNHFSRVFCMTTQVLIKLKV